MVRGSVYVITGLSHVTYLPQHPCGDFQNRPYLARCLGMSPSGSEILERTHCLKPAFAWSIKPDIFLRKINMCFTSRADQSWASVPTIFTHLLKAWYVTKAETTGLVGCQRVQPASTWALNSAACFQLFGSMDIALPLLATTELRLVQFFMEEDIVVLCPIVTTKACL